MTSQTSHLKLDWFHKLELHLHVIPNGENSKSQNLCCGHDQDQNHPGWEGLTKTFNPNIANFVLHITKVKAVKN